MLILTLAKSHTHKAENCGGTEVGKYTYSPLKVLSLNTAVIKHPSPPAQ